MSFEIYAIGYVIFMAGLLYAAHLMHVPAHWMVVGAVVLAGFGLMSAVRNTRHKDPS